MRKHDVLLTLPLHDVADARAPMRRSSPMGYAVTTMQRSPIPSSASFLQTIWRFCSPRGGVLHQLQEKTLRVSKPEQRQRKLGDIIKYFAPFFAVVLSVFLSAHCRLNALVYAGIWLGALAIFAVAFFALCRWIGTLMRGLWRDAWRLDDVVVCSFERPVTREMSVSATAAAARRQCIIDRDAREQARVLRERAGLIALTLSPRFSPIPTQARGA